MEQGGEGGDEGRGEGLLVVVGCWWGKGEGGGGCG